MSSNSRANFFKAVETRSKLAARSNTPLGNASPMVTSESKFSLNKPEMNKARGHTGRKNNNYVFEEIQKNATLQMVAVDVISIK